jgi:hypothetical protein
MLDVSLEDKRLSIPAYVISKNCVNILGLSSSEALGLIITRVNRLKLDSSLMNKYSSLFDGEVGFAKNHTVAIELEKVL